MYTRHNEVPVYESREGLLNAGIYNQVRLALKRLDRELRLSLPGLRHLDLILQPDAWIIVDRVLSDVPVVAWTDFKTKDRTALHTPVSCRVRLYHASAGAILERALTEMMSILDERLGHGNGHQVIDFPR
ncbi:hypothetical protein [Methylophaga sp. OBS4]|uniref:hypothetical protein n=1 Tax=Methylophaga sp. OBS4 TaxID=2991935 RepID=UPI00224DE93F|nr:hypothetical protein [Methylophaga sp. OBS4]MCX4188618.1 hypothetical protein [Methylophaga sp. OBS4]